MRGKRILSWSERERERGLDPCVTKEGPNDEMIKEHLEQLIVTGRKNELILIFE